MFTGIIQAFGEIEAVQPHDRDTRMIISCADLDMSGVIKGASIAVNGVCLTAVEVEGTRISVDISGETLSCTTFAGLEAGHRVNLEKSLLPTTPFSGHFVSGHVDGIGKVVGIGDEGRSVKLRIEIPPHLARYIAPKGSVCVDGVSLTVNHVAGKEFDVNIIPHTLMATTCGEYMVGRRVNIEVDIIARYLERLLQAREDTHVPVSDITEGFLAEYGYIKKSSSL